MQKGTIDVIKHTGHLLDKWLPVKIQYDRIPGLSVGIVHEDKLIYSSGFGTTELGKKRRPDKETLYHIASISKTFTATAIMKLVDEDKLRLDDKVSEYIDWFEGKDKGKNAGNITIRQLLSHTAGIFRDGDTPHWATGRFPKDLKQSFNSKSLVLENATAFKYTNYGFALLGLVIEKASGASYEKYVKENIFQPLKMGSTAPDYSEDISNLATGYGQDLPGQKRKEFSHDKTKAYAPATGFVSNVNDLSKFISAMQLDSNNTVISREAKKEMMRSHHRTDLENEYALGLDIFYIDSKKIVGHSGGFRGFSTQIMLDPQGRLGIIMLANTNYGSLGMVAEGVLRLIFQGIDNMQDHRGKSALYSKYEGLYRDDWGDTLVSSFGKKLLALWPGVNWPHKYSTELEPTRIPNEFKMKTHSVFYARDEIAKFSKFKSGKAQILMEGSQYSRRFNLKD